MKEVNWLFWFLYIIAWIIFVGLSIEFGGLLVNFVVSVYKPEIIGNLYQKLDLSALYNGSNLLFYGVYSFILFIAALKAILFYVVIMLMHKIDLTKPFTTFVSQKILQISYVTIAIGVFSHIAREVVSSMMHRGFITESLDQFWADPQAFILMGAVVYIIATIFKKGVEIQQENDLTI